MGEHGAEEVSNRNSGSEDIHKPFAKRRHAPGTSAGQFEVGYSEVSLAMSQAKSLTHAAKIAVNRFGVPRRIVRMVLRDPKRNNVKLMRLVLLSKKWWDKKKDASRDAVARVNGGRNGAKAFGKALGRSGSVRVPRRHRGSDGHPE